MLSNADTKEGWAYAKIRLKEIFDGRGTLVWKKEILTLFFYFYFILLHLEGITWARLSKLKASRAKKNISGWILVPTEYI